MTTPQPPDTDRPTTPAQASEPPTVETAAPARSSRRRALIATAAVATGGLAAGAAAQNWFSRTFLGAGKAAEPTAVAAPPPPPPLAYDRRLTAAVQMMAGITPEPGDPAVDALVATEAFRQHRTWMREQFAPVRARLTAMERWREQTVRVPDAANRTLLYPFSGPDFLNAYAMFPQHARYVFFSLERPSELPDLATKTPAQFAELFESLRGALRDIFERNYFITSYMSRQLTAPRLRGTLPLIGTMMALYGRVIVSAEAVDLFPDLTESYSRPSARRPAIPMRGVRVVFGDPATRRTQQLHYFSLDATDRALQFYPGFTGWLAAQGPATAMVKSASYLLHDRQFSQVRDTLVTTADFLLQDDTGVPFRVLRQSGWQVQLFGEYRYPLPSLAYGYQRDLQAAYEQAGRLPPLTFPFGYHWREGGAGSGLMIATRAPRSPAAAEPGTAPSTVPSAAPPANAPPNPSATPGAAAPAAPASGPAAPPSAN